MKMKKLHIPLWFNVVTKIKDDMNIHKLSIEGQYHYVYVYELIKLLEQKKLITARKSGRQRKILLTKKGKMFQETIFKIKDMIK